MNNLVYNSEKAVLNALHAKDFRSINKNQLMQFMSNIPNMDREVAIRCIEQFPNFKDYSLEMINHFYKLCEYSIKDNGRHSIEAYQTTLDQLKTILNNQDLSPSERRYIIEEMVCVGERIERVEDNNTRFKGKVLKTATNVLCFSLAVGSALLGVNIWKK